MSRQRELYHYEIRRQQVLAYIYVNGRRIRRRLSGFGDLGLNAEGKLVKGGLRAEKALARRLDQLHRDMERRLLSGETERQKKGQSVRVLMQEWINWGRSMRAPATVELYVDAANKFVRIVGNIPISDISIRQIDKFTSALVETGASAAHVNKILRTLKTFLNWAKAREEIEKVPKIEFLPEAQKIPKVLSEGDVMLLFNRIATLRNNTRDPIQKRAFLLHERFLWVAVNTGMRRSEIFYLPWAGIDFQRGVIRVLVQGRFMVKEKREKLVPLHNDLALYLADQRRQYPDEEWLMDSGMGKIFYNDPRRLTRIFRRHFIALGLGNSGVRANHGFRALMAGRMRQAGLDLAIIQGVLGHSRIQTTQRYFPNEQHLQSEAIKRLPSFGAGMARGQPLLAK